MPEKGEGGQEIYDTLLIEPIINLITAALHAVRARRRQPPYRYNNSAGPQKSRGRASPIRRRSPVNSRKQSDGPDLDLFPSSKRDAASHYPIPQVQPPIQPLRQLRYISAPI